MAVAHVSLLSDPIGWYHWALSFQHPLSVGFPLMSPLSCLGLICVYLISVKALFYHMKGRSKPYDVYYLALLHNVNCTALSLYMFVEITSQSYQLGYTWFGNGAPATEEARPMANVLWIFYASKVVEFMDTIIMVLKQNYRQVTFLHVYHHVSIFFIWWMVLYYGPGGEAYFSAALNSLVHIVMYGYYLWCTFAPKLSEGQRPSVFHPQFYKANITRMQLGQFVLDFFQATYDIFYLGEGNVNGFPLFLVWILFYYMISMVSLFSNFYIQAYMKGGKGKGKGKTEGKEKTNGHSNGVKKRN